MELFYLVIIILRLFRLHLPLLMTNFSSLGIDPKLLEAIDALGFQSPTEVQQKAVPILIEKETDIVVLAQTGTGKTAAFGLPMLQKIDTNSRTTQGLVIAPTSCLLYTSPSPRDGLLSRMPSSA